MSRLRRFFHRFLPDPPSQDLPHTIAAAARVEAEQNRRYRVESEVQARLRVLEDEAAAAKPVDREREEYVARCHELAEAKQMCGAGPWLVHEARGATNGTGLAVAVKESNPLISQGAYGDIELALQNVEWRREVNLSWLEFSRWGIQQIMLICRLYYIKNPIMRRLVNVCAAYVFARGVEVSSPDEAANETLDEFFKANKSVLGHVALCDLERRKDYDGNLFFVFFPDATATGKVKVRTLDATEVMDVICNPDDADEPWLYRRQWTQRDFRIADGSTQTHSVEAWYPALGYQPDEKPERINGFTVYWDSPVLHRRCGAVAKWHFGCPRMYPAIDWMRETKRFLESCASQVHALAQFAMTITTKGGQQAMMGLKQQLQTTAGPPSSLWDQNPPAGNSSIFVSGQGTDLKAFWQRGAGVDPEECRQYKLMACMVAGVPETFLADVSTGNLATATSLDRPTETAMLEKQEEWCEDLSTIAQYVLSVSAAAPSGKIREAHKGKVKIREAAYTRDAMGRRQYAEADAKPGTIEVKVTFPAIREGDIPALVNAVVAAGTLNNRGGQVVGIDEKQMVGLLYEYLGVKDGDELLEQQYPDSEYDPDRTKEVLTAPVPKLAIRPGGTPVEQDSVPHTEAALDRLHAALAARESAKHDTNGRA